MHSGKLLTWSTLTVQKAWIGIFIFPFAVFFCLFFCVRFSLSPLQSFYNSCTKFWAHTIFQCNKYPQHDVLGFAWRAFHEESSIFDLTGRSLWPGSIFVALRSMFQKSQVHPFFSTPAHVGFWQISSPCE